MLHTFRALWVVTTAVCFAMAGPVAQAQGLGARNMQKKAAVVSSLAPVFGAEAVQFSGQASVNSRVAIEPGINNPMLVMMFDMTGVTGIGAATRTQYVLTSQEYVVRPHVANQVIEFSFPMATDVDAPIAAVRTGTARFALNVDLATGTVTSMAVSLQPR